MGPWSDETAHSSHEIVRRTPRWLAGAAIFSVGCAATITASSWIRLDVVGIDSDIASIERARTDSASSARTTFLLGDV